MNKPYVVVIGSLNYDIIAKQERMPEKGETVTGQDVVQGPGGKGANQAAATSLLGVPTYMVGKVGDDRFGDALVGSLQAFKVNVDHIGRLGSTGLGLVHSMPDGDYYSTVIPGANQLIGPEDVDEISDLVSEAEYLILQEEISLTTTDYILEKFADEPVKIVLNDAPGHVLSDQQLSR